MLSAQTEAATSILQLDLTANDPNAPPVLAYSSLVAANVSTGKSDESRQTFQLNPAGNVTGGVPIDDRQWLEFHGKNSVYLLVSNDRTDDRDGPTF